MDLDGSRGGKDVDNSYHVSSSISISMNVVWSICLFQDSLFFHKSIDNLEVFPDTGNYIWGNSNWIDFGG